MKKKPKIVWLVYMNNKTDSRDDEVFKIKARSASEAKDIASNIDSWRWCVGWAQKWKAPSSKPYRWWATDYTKI